MYNLKRLFKALFVIGICLYLILALWVGTQVHEDNYTTSDAIVVLGAKSYKEGKYNPCLVARVVHAASLYKDHHAPKIIMSGGTDKEDQANEAEVMRQIAQNTGVTEEDILLEKTSRSTYENLANVKKILDEQHIEKIILVTEPFHNLRASLVASHLGIAHTMSPSIDSPCWQKWKYLSRYFWREPLAIIAYWLTGKA